MAHFRPRPPALLAGVVFVLLVVVAFVLGGETPDVDASGREVVDFYSDNNGQQKATAFLIGFSALFGGIFLANLYATLRLAAPLSAWPVLALVGGTIAIAGFLLLGSIHLALAEGVDKGYAPEVLRPLNALDNDAFFPAAAGAALLMIGSGAALVSSGTPPRWLGWIGIVVGLLGFTPLGFLAFVLSGLWVIVLSVVCYQRLSRDQAGDGRNVAPAG